MNCPLLSLKPWLPALALAAPLAAQIRSPSPTDDAAAQAQRTLRQHADPLPAGLLGTTAIAEGRVVFDQPGDGRIWALGADYKASFGSDGFVYVPFFGSQAPRNYPVRFAVGSVRVGGRELAVDAAATATRSDARVTFHRGPVQEIYDLTPRSIEQTFVVDGSLPGDVEVELEITTDLVEDAARAGIQLGNELGSVEYGTAYLVRGNDKTEIPATLVGNTLRLQVPAAERGPGAVVIDPIIRSFQLTPTLMTSEIPDPAYDATTDRFAVTWVHVFSQADHDVVVEMRTGNGEAIAGSFKPIDIAGTSHSWPRIANLNNNDRFLIAMERFVPSNPVGQQYTVWGRLVDATAPFATSALFPISPSSTVDQLSVDVGGDPGNGTRWLVVWRHGTDIHGRLVEWNGSLGANVLPIESTNAVCINPQVSLSNGNGLTPVPCWCVVYQLRTSDTNWDVYGGLIDPSGAFLGSHLPINRGSTNDMYPYVSSPLVDGRPKPAFLVSYERQVSPPEMQGKVIDSDFNIVVAEENLTRRFGFSGIYNRVESDGIRFAATCQLGTRLSVATLAVTNNNFVLHETLQDLGHADSPAIASKRSGGGLPTDYGVVYDTTNAPARVVLSIYQGRAPAGGFSRRSTACGLSINGTGRPYVGETAFFVLSNAGTDLPLLLLGVPAPAVPMCANCSLGLDVTGPLIPFAAPLTLLLPAEPKLVGLTLAVQGLAVGSGPCPGAVRVSDTIDFTIQ